MLIGIIVRHPTTPCSVATSLLRDLFANTSLDLNPDVRPPVVDDGIGAGMGQKAAKAYVSARDASEVVKLVREFGYTPYVTLTDESNTPLPSGPPILIE